MINKFQAFNLMRTSAYCEKKVSGDFTTYKISICGAAIATVQKFKRGNKKGMNPMLIGIVCRVVNRII